MNSVAIRESIDEDEAADVFRGLRDAALTVLEMIVVAVPLLADFTEIGLPPLELLILEEPPRILFSLSNLDKAIA